MPQHFNTIADRFRAREGERSSKTERARDHSRIVDPTILPEQNFSQISDLPVPYSSSVTRFKSRLASKAAGAIVPINNTPFFQLFVPGFTMDDEEELYNSLFDMEDAVLNQLLSSNLRVALTSAMEHLIVTGDTVLFMDDDFNFQLYRLDQFTIKRDGAGRWKELIVRDWIDVDLEDPVFAAANGGTKKDPTGPASGNKNLEPRFCMIHWDQKMNKYIKTVEFRGQTIEEFSGEYEEHLCPYFPLRWSYLANEDYARSLVEENIGDIRSVEGLAKAFIEGAGAASEGRVLINPTGFTQIEDLEDSLNWGYVAGRREDVDFLQADNTMQLQQTFTAKEAIERGLSAVFLADQIAQLDGDRVTATQIRAIAANLEEALGGVFSLIARDLQLPLVRRAMYLTRKNDFLGLEEEGVEDPDLRLYELIDNNALDIQVRTGLDALGRELDAARITSVLNIILQYPQEAQTVVKWDEATRDLIRTQGINADWVRSAEEQDALKQQQVAQNLAPEALKSIMGQGLTNGPTADSGQSG